MFISFSATANEWVALGSLAFSLTRTVKCVRLYNISWKYKLDACVPAGTCVSVEANTCSQKKTLGSCQMFRATTSPIGAQNG